MELAFFIGLGIGILVGALGERMRKENDGVR
jgi:hypothetical protein